MKHGNEQTHDEVMEAAGTLEGYTCRDEEETIVCEKEHWSGSYWFTFIFADGKLDAIDVLFTSDVLKSLNYTEETNNNIYQTEDLSRRLTYTEFGSYTDAPGTFSGRVFPTSETVISPVYDWNKAECIVYDDSVLIQTGFRPISETNPTFKLEVILASWRFFSKLDFPPADKSHYYTSKSGNKYYRVESVDAEGRWGMTYISENGEKTIVPELGYASYRQVDSESADGRVITLYFYDLDNNPVTGLSSNAAAERSTYNIAFELIRRDYIDPEGNLTNLKDKGYSTILYSKDPETGKNVAVDHLDQDGNHVDVE